MRLGEGEILIDLAMWVHAATVTDGLRRRVPKSIEHFQVYIFNSFTKYGRPQNMFSRHVSILRRTITPGSYNRPTDGQSNL